MRTLQLVEWAGRAVLRLAPPAYRATWQPDVLATLREACLAAQRRAGWRGLVVTSLRELSSIARLALRARVGTAPGLTAPGATSSGDARRSPRQFMSRLRLDLRLALRSLLAAKLVTAVAIGTLALGVGVNAAVFSILDSALFRPVPFADADRYAEIWTVVNNGAFSTPRSGPGAIVEWRRQRDVFDRVEGYETDSFVLTTERGAEMVTGAYVTPGLMPMLGMPPLAGRLLTAGDGRADSPAVVVISEGFWRDAMRRDPDAVGRSLTLGGQAYQIVGIAPASFRFPTGAAQVWLPHDPAAAAERRRPMVVFVRLAPGMTIDAATEHVKARAPGILKALGARATDSAMIYRNFGAVGRPLQQSLWVLGGAVGFLLLIVCANLASLSFSRTLTRVRDFAVRGALGASRLDLVRGTLVEHLIIGAAGSAAGLLVARAVLEATVSLMPEGALLRSMNAIDLDARALAFTGAAGLMAAVLFGLPPALIASRAHVADALKQQSRASAGSAHARRFRSVMVVAEVALAVVLLVGAALMARSFVKLVAVDRGFNTAGLVALRVGLPAAGFADSNQRDVFTEALIARARRLPGVLAATAGGVPPEASLISFGAIEFERASGQTTADLVLPIYQVWPGYFDVVGIPIRAGRVFSSAEPLESVIVSETFARQHFPSVAAAVGARFRLGTGIWRTIVGVAGEVRQLELDDQEGTFEFYYPLKRPVGLPPAAPPTDPRAIVEYRTFVARADDANATAAAMREIVHDVDPRVVVWRSVPVERAFADAVARPRLVMLLLAVFAAMGLTLAAAGIYGVLSCLVAQRQREIGIRLALGAVPRAIGRVLLRSGLGLTAVGVVIGVAGALSLVQVMQNLLYQVEPSDPWSIAAVVGVLLMTALAASWWPARRAMRLDPLALLRED